MSVRKGQAFDEWLRLQLKVRQMSQRQLAHKSGVDHSTISRIVRCDRTPSLGTATKLARALRVPLGGDADMPHFFETVAAAATTHPIARVEYALRADEVLSEPQARQVMEFYLALRMRRIPGAQRHHGRAARP